MRSSVLASVDVIEIIIIIIIRFVEAINKRQDPGDAQNSRKAFRNYN
jgi:hypothetical protein